MDWTSDGSDWPNRASSRFVDVGRSRWHVQVLGDGPPILLLHGTGAATHSWRDLAPLLARRFRVVAPDLPRHGFSTAGDDDAMSLPGMGRALQALLSRIDCHPVAAVGHSAGAAVLARMALDHRLPTLRTLLALNGALLPLDGPLRVLSPVARLLAWMPLVPQTFARRARDPAAVRRLIDGTGSTLDARGIDLYGRLLRDPAHVSGGLAMMANWDLDGLARELARLPCPLHLIVGTGDRTVSPAQADRVAARIPEASVTRLTGLGHLAHEEDPIRVARVILEHCHHEGARPAPPIVAPPAPAASASTDPSSFQSSDGKVHGCVPDRRESMVPGGLHPRPGRASIVRVTLDR
jgi:magnesium chelatase accessory protein